MKQHPSEKKIQQEKLGTRINVYLREEQIASRRGADELVAAGRVFVNGVAAKPGSLVYEGDLVQLKGEEKKYHYFAYNKPKGIVTTNAQKGEKDILRSTRFPVKKVFPVGRLDKDSRGLLIITDDGRITKPLLEPEFDHEKEYEVTTEKPFNDAFLKKMSAGVNIGDYTTKPCKMKRLGDKKFSIILTEGKNRQIRRMCEALGHRVHDLNRVRIMNVLLGSLEEGRFRELTGDAKTRLLKSLGIKH
jgi:23S rRNA pseudouridine2604 synthase